MVEQNDSLLREVDEELRRERLERLWDRYGTYILAGAACIVIGVGGYKYWQYSAQQSAQTNGVLFEDAMRLVGEDKAAEAEKAFKAIADKGAPGYGVLSRLQLAALLTKGGKTEEAAKAFDAVAADTSVDELYRAYARLQSATLMLGKADWTAMQNRLNDLTAEKSPWRYQAKELLGFAAIQAGKTSEARQYFVQLALPGVPAGIRQRADSMLTMLSGGEAPANAPKADNAAAPNAAAPKDGAAKK